MHNWMCNTFIQQCESGSESMRRDNDHLLLIWLLALVVVFAPMQAAVSSIEMLVHHNGQTPHCQMAMDDDRDHANMEHPGMDHDTMGQGDCCGHDGPCQGNCPSCAQCISVHPALFGQAARQEPAVNQFIYQKTFLAKGIPGRGEYRPPRLFS